MKFTLPIIAALAAISPAAAAPADSVSMMASVPEWTIESMKRTCKSGTCTWTFNIDTHTAAATPCTMVVKGNPASHANGGPVTCGPYTVTSGWSGQFGAGNGFTTLSVVDYSKKLIIWPAYTDKQLVNGVVVKPDQSYAPTKLA